MRKKKKIVREFMCFCEIGKSFLDQEEIGEVVNWNLGTKVIWKPQEINLCSWERKEGLFIKLGFTKFPRIKCFFSLRYCEHVRKHWKSQRTDRILCMTEEFDRNDLIWASQGLFQRWTKGNFQYTPEGLNLSPEQTMLYKDFILTKNFSLLTVRLALFSIV